MQHRARVGLVLLLVAAFGRLPDAFAAQTDMQSIRTIVTRAPGCTLPPNTDANVCLKVVVKNNGPDTYVGGPVPGKAGGNPYIQAGELKVTVDIDEPSGKVSPGDPREIQSIFTRNFALTLAPGDSATLDFGPIGWQPYCGGTHTAGARSTAQGANIDPNPANDRAVTIFYVIENTPTSSEVGVLAAVAALLGVGTWFVWRRRRPAAMRR